MIPKRIDDDLRQMWQTPDALFQGLHSIFDFTVDAFAQAQDAKLPRYFSEATYSQCDFERVWRGERVFANPPFQAMRYVFWMFSMAETSIVIAPLDTLATKYCHENPPRMVFLPSQKTVYQAPPGLQSRHTKCPTFVSVLLAFGKISQSQKSRVCDLPFYDSPLVPLNWNPQES